MTSLLDQVSTHAPFDDHEAAMTLRLKKFLRANENPFDRELLGTPPEIGHVTGSAWIVNGDYSRTVLLFHGKLRKWVQPGGHCDSESNVLKVAMREAGEETGLCVAALRTAVFDIDVHEIPEYWNTPAHLHFDARYLLRADDKQLPVCSDESKAVRWVSLEEALKLSREESIARMIEKTRRLAQR